ncbi:SOS response-associated peptidase [Candidatus Xianfuyuplasma coldseepsis]|uniref:Abasic site processing protein n=1 Tax=Candidatus Xianfuyuplasma coldseepsis TaxID=2782163 RepID=A0A7L7KSJ2_9MOLU|nr:SOS response-associated peptidase [Xianfuyuplasma coldseepsis]QMS85565.1 SOS response-associated peptidase [Xianfuyuplasma coldseepsis]
MCGRFVVSYTYDELVSFLQGAFDIQEVDLIDWEPRYNVAPGQEVLSVIHDGKQYRAGTLRWGFVPSWSKDSNSGYKMINARGETIDKKPSFKESFQQKRCVLLADAFYEWKRVGSSKQPMCIQMNDQRMFLLAGLWSRTIQEDGSALFTTTIVTTSSNSLMEDVHDRMPAILSVEDAMTWLDSSTPIGDVKELIHPYDSDQMMMYPVSTMVNSVKNDSIECMIPLQK